MAPLQMCKCADSFQQACGKLSAFHAFSTNGKKKERSLWQATSKILALISSSWSHSLHWSWSWHPPRLVTHTHAGGRAPPHSMTGAHVAMGAHHWAARPTCHGLAAHGALAAISHSVSQSWHHCSHTSVSPACHYHFLLITTANEKQERKKQTHQIIYCPIPSLMIVKVN